MHKLAILAEKPQVVSIKITDARQDGLAVPVDMITCEYPPTVGGIADYSREVAMGISRGGIPVRVWVRGGEGIERVNQSVTVSRSLGRFGIGSLLRAGRAMRRAGGGRCLLLQWEPVGYGAMSVNLPFCFWIALQGLLGTKLIVMFHETFLSYSKRTPKRFAGATLQRLMAFLLVRFACKVFVSTGSGAQAIGRLSGNRQKVEHLPVFSNIETRNDPEYARELRAEFASPEETLVGHFGRYNTDIESLVVPALTSLLRRNGKIKVVFAGECANNYRETLIAADPDLEARVHSAGRCSPKEVASLLAACDFMFQPYPDGITTRRSTTMAALANGRFLVSNMGAASEDLWRQTSSVHLLAGQNPEEQAEEIDRLSQDAGRIAQGAAEARRFYQRNFSAERTLRALNACLRTN